MKATIDVDIGGTFTDCYLTYGDRRVWCKTRTTAYDLSVAMNETIEEGAARLGISTEQLLADAAIIRYSTTLAMNRLIEHKGPKLGLLITEGFEDTTLIGRASQWSDGVPIKYQRNIAGHRSARAADRQGVDRRREGTRRLAGEDRPTARRGRSAGQDPVPGRRGRARVRRLAAVVVPRAGPRTADQGDSRAGVPRRLPGGDAGVPVLGRRARGCTSTRAR